MSRLYELKRKLLLHNRVALEHQAKEHAGELARKQDFCEAMRMEAVREKVKCEAAKMMLYRVVCGYSTLNQRMRDVRWIVEGWRRWKQYAQDRRAMKVNLKKAVQFYDRVSVLRNSLRQWRNWARDAAKERREYEYQRDIIKAQREARAKDAALIEQLTAELADARMKLASADAQRSELETSMRQAFMRGVCALNLEAMQVMRRGKGAAQSSTVAASQAEGERQAAAAVEAADLENMPPNPRGFAPPAAHMP